MRHRVLSLVDTVFDHRYIALFPLKMARTVWNGMNLWILGVCVYVCLVRSFNKGAIVMNKCTIHFKPHICKNKLVFSFSIVMHGFACIFFSFLFLFFFCIFSSLAVILVVICCSWCVWAIFKGAYLPKKKYSYDIRTHMIFFPFYPFLF